MKVPRRRKTAPRGAGRPGPAATAEALPLGAVQGNILEPHARECADHLFLEFTAPYGGVRDFLRGLGWRRVSSAAAERVERKAPAAPFCSVLLTRRGYEKIGALVPADGAFRQGMRDRVPLLNDPSADAWARPWREARIDALVILANNDPVALARESVRVVQEAHAAGVRLAFSEYGRRMLAGTRSIEHFGYHDGISQPRFFRSSERPWSTWDTLAEPGLVLVPEGGGADRFGSFFVFRKLEQDVRLWNESVLALAAARGEDPELVGARAMGRFRDGTPLVEYARPQESAHAADDFDYARDPRGRRCPFHAHIRKSNPRGEAPGASLREQRGRRIARRGIPYGVRPDLDPSGVFRVAPRTGVGLLFSCYQADIAGQFEYVQRHWINDPDHPVPGAGVDAVIGQPAPAAPVEHPALHRAVRLLGGDYFHSPSIPFLREL